MRRIGKGFSRVDTHLFDGMLVQQQVQAVKDAAEDEDDDNETCATLTKQVANLEQDKIAQAIEISKLKKSVRRRMHPNRGKIVELDADEDVTLVDAKEYMNADDTNEVEPAKVEEVIKVVTTAKLMTEVVTTVATTITVAQVPKASALRRRRGVVIQVPEETATALVILHSKDDVIEQVKRREKQDNTVMRYQALKRKPITKAQERKNMMIYLKNMVGFKMDLFKGEKEIEEEGSKRKGDSLNQDAAKKQRIDKETEELKTHL
nr:hypothetical protein [Tanacetum cinerariifolium]